MTTLTVLLIFLSATGLSQVDSFIFKQVFRTISDIIGSSPSEKKMPSLDTVTSKCCSNLDPAERKRIEQTLLDVVQFEIDLLKDKGTVPSFPEIKTDVQHRLLSDGLEKYFKERLDLRTISDNVTYSARLLWSAWNVYKYIIERVKATNGIPALPFVTEQVDLKTTWAKKSIFAKVILDFTREQLRSFGRTGFLPHPHLVMLKLNRLLSKSKYQFEDSEEVTTSRPTEVNQFILKQAFNLVWVMLKEFVKTQKLPPLYLVIFQCKHKFKTRKPEIIAEALLKFVERMIFLYRNELSFLTSELIRKELKPVLVELNLGIEEPHVTTDQTTEGPPKDDTDITTKPPTTSERTTISKVEFDDIVKMPKETLIGVSEKILTIVVEKICSENTERKLMEVDTSKMVLKLITACRTASVDLMDASSLWNHPDFNTEKKVVLLVAGWSKSPDGKDVIQEMAKAYSCRGSINFVALNLDHTYLNLQELFNVDIKKIGLALSNALIVLSERIPTENIHLIGQSVGAHVAAYAAKEFSARTDKAIKRITGLDPAGICYKPGREDEHFAIQESLAEVVDLIHTTPGIMGVRDPKGTVDFYPQSINSMQPGCTNVICSHARAWQYFVETVYPGSDEHFMSAGCQQSEPKCDRPMASMGFGLQLGLTGSYYLTAFARPPYGKEFFIDESYPIYVKKCGLCKNPKATESPNSLASTN